MPEPPPHLAWKLTWASGVKAAPIWSIAEGQFFWAQSLSKYLSGHPTWSRAQGELCSGIVPSVKTPIKGSRVHLLSSSIRVQPSIW